MERDAQPRQGHHHRHQGLRSRGVRKEDRNASQTDHSVVGMTEASPLEKRLSRTLTIVERVVVITMIVLLVLVLLVAVVELWGLFVSRTGGRLGDIATAQDFQDILQNAFGGILVVFVGLE